MCSSGNLGPLGEPRTDGEVLSYKGVPVMGDCIICNKPTNQFVENITVGDAIVVVTKPMCETCKKAYELGYKDGLDDS